MKRPDFVLNNDHKIWFQLQDSLDAQIDYLLERILIARKLDHLFLSISQSLVIPNTELAQKYNLSGMSVPLTHFMYLRPYVENHRNKSAFNYENSTDIDHLHFFTNWLGATIDLDVDSESSDTYQRITSYVNVKYSYGANYHYTPLTSIPHSENPIHSRAQSSSFDKKTRFCILRQLLNVGRSNSRIFSGIEKDYVKSYVFTLGREVDCPSKVYKFIDETCLGDSYIGVLGNPELRTLISSCIRANIYIESASTRLFDIVRTKHANRLFLTLDECPFIDNDKKLKTITRILKSIRDRDECVVE